jgi:hypothetical protein
MDAEQHLKKVDGLRRQHNHDVRFVEFGGGTCGTYAFDLWNDQDYEYFARFRDIYAGFEFFRWVIARLAEVDVPEVGSLVVYFNAAGPCHVGIVISGEPLRIRSKWGEMPVYDHPLSEIPAEYGEMARFYLFPVEAEPSTLFFDYALTPRESAPI